MFTVDYDYLEDSIIDGHILDANIEGDENEDKYDSIVYNIYYATIDSYYVDRYDEYCYDPDGVQHNLRQNCLINYFKIIDLFNEIKDKAGFELDTIQISTDDNYDYFININELTEELESCDLKDEEFSIEDGVITFHTYKGIFDNLPLTAAIYQYEKREGKKIEKVNLITHSKYSLR